MMAHEGWKYFQVKNLNELFSIMFDKYGIDENAVAMVDGGNFDLSIEDNPIFKSPTFGPTDENE